MENNVFNQLASKYDTNERIALSKIILSAIRPEIETKKNQTLLDYGSGTGLIGLELSSLVDRLFLMDSSESMLEVVREKITRNKIQNAEVIYGDFSKSDFDLRADSIIASLVLLHVPVLDTLLSHIHSVLNKNGKLIVVDFDKNERVYHPAVHNGFEHGDLRSMLIQAGFDNVEIKTFHHGEKIFMNQDASLLICTATK